MVACTLRGRYEKEEVRRRGEGQFVDCWLFAYGQKDVSPWMDKASGVFLPKAPPSGPLYIRGRI